MTRATISTDRRLRKWKAASRRAGLAVAAGALTLTLSVLAMPRPAVASVKSNRDAARESVNLRLDQTPRLNAGRFIARLVVQKALARYDAAWKTLHPFHQGVAGRAEYVACEQLTAFPGRVGKVKVTRVFDDPVLIAGMTAPVPSKGVTVRVTVWTPFAARPTVVTHTFHAVAVNGRWAWILTPERFDAYAADSCPALG